MLSVDVMSVAMFCAVMQSIIILKESLRWVWLYQVL